MRPAFFLSGKLPAGPAGFFCAPSDGLSAGFQVQNRKRIALTVRRTAAVNGKTVLAVKFQGGGIWLVDVNRRDAAPSDGKSRQFGAGTPVETVR
jgi:hypothetical protein